MSTEIAGTGRTNRALSRKQARELENWVEKNSERLASGVLQRDVISALATQGCGFDVSYYSIKAAAEIVNVALNPKRAAKPRKARSAEGRKHNSPGWLATVSLFDVVKKIADGLGVAIPNELSETVEYMRRNNRARSLPEGGKLFDR